MKKLLDTLNFFTKFTPNRLLNAFKVKLSYWLAKATKRPFHWGMPLSISIEPTTACNLRCPECPSGLRLFTRNTGFIEETPFKKIIDEQQNTILYLNFFFQGEPYLHSKFFELVQYAHKKKIYVSTATNAHYLDNEQARKTVECGLNRLIISLDGVTQETYSAYRVGGQLEKVKEGIRNVVYWKLRLKSRTPFVIIQFLVLGTNEHEIPEVKQVGKELGVDEVRLKTAQVYDYEKGNRFIPSDERFSRYIRDADGKFKPRIIRYNHCWRLWRGCVITWDGMVVPCCFDKDAKYTMGNITSNPFTEVWNDSKLKQFRQKILHSRSSIDICTNCDEGMKVWI